jgi:hypothetical protein
MCKPPLFSSERNSLKASLALSLDNSHSLIDAISRNPENPSANTDVNHLFKAIDAVSANDVNAVRYLS